MKKKNPNREYKVLFHFKTGSNTDITPEKLEEYINNLFYQRHDEAHAYYCVRCKTDLVGQHPAQLNVVSSKVINALSSICAVIRYEV